MNQSALDNLLNWLLSLEDSQLRGVIIDLGDGAGLTRFGITQKFDGASVPPSFWSTMNRDEALAAARQFYQTKFWDMLSLGDLGNVVLAASVLSCAVNCGAGRAIELCEQALEVAPRNWTAIRAALNEAAQAPLLQRFVAAWQAYYKGLVDRTPEDARYLAGWLARAARLYDPKVVTPIPPYQP